MKQAIEEALKLLQTGQALDVPKAIQILNWYNDYEYRIKPTPRPQWQQDLIDAAKAGKVVEFNDNGWYPSALCVHMDQYNFTGATQVQYRIKTEQKPVDYAYEMIDRFIRNNLDDDDYSEYSNALNSLCSPPRKPWIDLTFYDVPNDKAGDIDFRAGALWASQLLKERNT